MIRFIVIYTTPLQQLHDAAGEPYIDPTQISLPILQGLGAQHSSVTGEVPNVTAVARNSNGQATAAWARPPLGAEAAEFGVIDGEPVELMRYVVTRVVLAETGNLEMTA